MRLQQLLLVALFCLSALGCDMGGGEDFNKPIAIGKKKRKKETVILKKEEAPKQQAPKLLPGEATITVETSK